MVQRNFDLQQVEKRINDLYDYLSQRKLRLGSKYNTLDSLNLVYDDIDKLSHRLGKLKGLFNHSVVDVLDEKNNAVMMDAMMNLPEDKAIQLIKNLRAKNQKIHDENDSTNQVETNQSSSNNPNYETPFPDDSSSNS